MQAAAARLASARMLVYEFMKLKFSMVANESADRIAVVGASAFDFLVGSKRCRIRLFASSRDTFAQRPTGELVSGDRKIRIECYFLLASHVCGGEHFLCVNILFIFQFGEEKRERKCC